ncbi:MAG: DUF5665 domain-containing protein [Candidatus Daviesbacteria bacterium]|nr:DUF5665 domain-containing protein [Candidatus Daviesbacteria bacterium]
MEATPQIESHLTANMSISKKDIIVGNFLGGFAWGIGSVVGATIIVALVGLILNSLGVFNAIGGFFQGLSNINRQLPQFQQLFQ